MSQRSEFLYHRETGLPADTWSGFSWPGFFLTWIWLFHKTLPEKGLGVLLLNVICGVWVLFGHPLGIIGAWFVMGVAALHVGWNGNQWHRDSLLEAGFNRKQIAQSAFSGELIQERRASSSIADELSKLAQLRDQKILSPEEFEKAKTRVLAGE